MIGGAGVTSSASCSPSSNDAPAANAAGLKSGPKSTTRSPVVRAAIAS
ncbi:MAG: hypothetical protein JO103_12245 [Candidatus Eremiobacteraeota bacterium]|nr:hypothetical protein [Candidatus Eremiobacteraeota bacterium]